MWYKKVLPVPLFCVGITLPFLNNLYPWSHSFILAHDHRWGLKIRSTGKSKTSPSRNLLLHYSVTADTGTNPHIDLTLYLNLILNLLLISTTLRYLNSFTCGSSTFPTQREQSTIFRQRTMASDLEWCWLSSQLLQCVLKVTVWRSQQSHNICQQQRSNSKVPKPWFGHLIKMSPGPLLLEVFQSHPTGRRPRGRPRTHWRINISHLAWEYVRILRTHSQP